jgi:hypothetical protein
MPLELMTVLEAYSPDFVCSKCLAFVVQQDETIVVRALSGLVALGQVESAQAVCVECGIGRTVMRARHASRIAG